MNARGIFGVFLAILAASWLIAALSCSHKNSATPAGTSGIDSAEISTGLDDALGELAALETPAWADDALLERLKSALASALVAKFATEGRAISKAPIGVAGKVADLSFNPGGGTVTWSYRNTGDYDLSGEVSIADITPIAMHYLAKVETGMESDYVGWLDFDGNREVGIPDVTAIALWYLNSVAVYEILTGDALGGEFVKIGEAEYPTEPAFPVRFSFAVPEEAASYVAVRPLGADGSQGEMSEPVRVKHFTAPPPPAYLTASQDAPGKIILTWVKSQDATGYKIYRDILNTPLAYAGDVDYWEDLDVPDFEYHVYRVKAVNPAGESDFSQPATGLQGELPPPAPPQITGVVPVSGVEGKSVVFNAELTGDLPLAYLWYFGEAAEPYASTDKSPSVTLGARGTYDCSLMVNNPYGVQVFDFTLSVLRDGINPPPVAVFTANKTEGTMPLAVTFNPAASFDPDGTIVKY